MIKFTKWKLHNVIYKCVIRIIEFINIQRCLSVIKY